ncbi:MAG TPA: LptE family protein [Longimicrobiales bacterium]|jgi:hypothetical protein|nr:LptE family protein [Longimicrobiales bacterium]
MPSTTDLRRFAAAAGAAILLGSGCNYSLRGGSFPEHIRTIAVLPFENETTRLELTQELFDVMSRELPPALGVQTAAPENADAVVQGTITSYDLSTPNYRAGAGGDRAEVLQRQVTIAVSVEIVDRVENVILFESTALRGQGQYLEQSETEDDGKQEAIEIMVQRIVDGAQSNW